MEKLLTVLQETKQASLGNVYESSTTKEKRETKATESLNKPPTYFFLPIATRHPRKGREQGSLQFNGLPFLW
jgi:cytoskeletal protein RodZ